VVEVHADSCYIEMTLVPPEIEAFFVYSDRFGVTEQTEDEKVLYYWPPDAPPNDKMNNVGLCQGVIGFARYAYYHVLFLIYD